MNSDTGNQAEVWVAGGASSLVKGNLQRKLSQHGLKIGKHLEGDKEVIRLKRIPSGVAGVIVIKDLASHFLSERMSQLAKENGVPCALVQRKWAQAEPILRVKGILPADAISTREAAEDTTLIEDTTLSYILDSRDGVYTPSHSEVEAALKRAFGRSFVLSHTLYGRCVAKAATIPPTAPKEAPVTQKGSSCVKHPTLVPPQIIEGVSLLVEDDPESILDIPKLKASLVSLLGREFDYPDDLDRILRQMIVDLRAWWNPDPSAHSDEVVQAREHRNRLMSIWILKLLRPHYREGQIVGTPPSQVSIWKRSKEIFGCQIKWEIVQSAKEELTGGAIPFKDAYRHYESGCISRSRSPVTEGVFRTLLEKGKIKAFRNGAKQWMVRPQDIDQHLDRWTMPDTGPLPSLPSVAAVEAAVSNPISRYEEAVVASVLDEVPVAPTVPLSLVEADERGADEVETLREEIESLRKALADTTAERERELQARVGEAVAAAVAPLEGKIEALMEALKETRSQAPAEQMPASEDAFLHVVRTAKALGVTIEFKITP